MSSGVIFLDKPLGWTSRQAVNEIVRMFPKKGEKRIRAGHAGTLDPLATGMLPVLVGEATRFASVGLAADKEYEVSLDLSYQTDTLDREGEITARYDGRIDEERLLDVLTAFAGEQQQVPPAYSSIRIEGRRAHALARRGEAPAMEARTVHIHELHLTAFNFPVVSLYVHCSKGTYIRALARDIGERLGMGGCVTALRRLSTGGWPPSLMVTIEEVARKRESCILPLSEWLRDLPVMHLEKAEARRFLQGQRLQLPEGSCKGTVAVFHGDILLGTADIRPGQTRMVLHPVKILPSAQGRLL
ncbi:MAG: tRNA pseudouridine(55) synthase TruB [Mariprofundaceae bacterium]|nr:tRNA pseudouridine(55) synthase TruB [Mariprofundaceae bacterium]